MAPWVGAFIGDPLSQGPSLLIPLYKSTDQTDRGEEVARQPVMALGDMA